MVDVTFPLLSAPGRETNATGGRLINCFPEKLSSSAGKPYAYWRCSGLTTFSTTGVSGAFRGGIQIGSFAYVVVGTKCIKIASDGTPTVQTGNVTGSDQVFIFANNKATPDVVIVSPANGAFVVSGGAVSSYPDADVGSPNAGCIHKGFFIFTYGNAATIASDVNSTNINPVNTATAESKPDGLSVPMPLGNGQLLLCGPASMEVWGGINDTGYPFSYVATIARGVVGPYAITGNQDGWGKGIFLVGDDWKVHMLDGYVPTPISTPDVDLAIEAEPTKSSITVSCYVSQGHGFVVVQGTSFTWEYDTTLQTWHERQSYGLTYWRGRRPFKAFDKWLCGDSKTGNILEITRSAQDELGDPLNMRIETGPFGAFPQSTRINTIELYLTKGVGIAGGTDPTQRDPVVGISVSTDGGQTWSNQRQEKIGQQAQMNNRVRSSIWGQGDVQGIRWRFDFSANVDFGFMGADMDVDKLR